MADRSVAVEILLKLMGVDKAAQDTDEFKKKSEQLEATLEKAKEKVSEFGKVALGVFTGGALLGGVQGFGHLLEGVFDAGKDAALSMDKLTLAFDGNAESAKKASEAAETIGQKYGILPEHLKEISANAAIMGATNAKTNESLTTLAGGLEKLNLPGLNAQSVLKGFLHGSNDPEGKEGLGRLDQLVPGLAIKLQGITDPAEKARVAMEALQGKFSVLADQAGDPAHASEALSIAFTELKEKAGAPLFEFFSSVAAPILKGLVSGIISVVEFLKNMPGPMQTILKIGGGLVLAIGAITGAFVAWNVVSNLAIAKQIEQAATTGLQTIATWLGVTATDAMTFSELAAAVATAALTVAMVVLTSPITLIIAGIALLVAGVIYAYNNFTFFKNIIDGIAQFFVGVWNIVVANVIEKWNQFVNFINLSIAAFKYLYERLGPLKTVIDAVVGAVKGAVEWIGNLFSSTDKATEASKKHAEQLDEEKQKSDELAASIKAQAQARQAQVDSYGAFKDNLQKDRETAEAQLNQITEELAITTDQNRRKQLLQAQQTYLETAKTFHQKLQQIAADEEANRIKVEGADDTKNKTPKQGKDLSAQISEFIKLNKALEDSNRQSIDETIKAFADKKAALDKDRDTQEAHLRATIADATKLKAALDKLAVDRIESENALSQAIESEEKKRADIIKNAQKEQGSELGAHLLETEDKYQSNLKAIQEYRVKNLGKGEAEYYALEVQAQKSRDDEILKVVRADNDAKNKTKIDSLKSSLNEEKQELLQQASAMGLDVADVEERFARVSAQRKLDLDKENLELNKQAAIDTIKDKAILDKELARLDSEYRKANADTYAQLGTDIYAIDVKRIADKKKLLDEDANSISDAADRELALLQDQYDADVAMNDDKLKAKLISQQEHDKQMLLLSQKFENDRDTAILKQRQQFEKSLEKLFTAETDALLKNLLQQDKAQQQTQSLDLAKDKNSHDKKLVQLSDELRANKISYSEYTAGVAEADQQLADQQQKIRDANQSGIVKAAHQELDSMIDTATKQIFAQQAVATAGAFGWLFTTFGPIAGPALAVAAEVLISGLFKGLLGGILGSKESGGAAESGRDGEPKGIYHANEHIISAPDVRAAGGHSGVMQAIAAAKSVRNAIATPRQLNPAMRTTSEAVQSRSSQMLANAVNGLVANGIKIGGELMDDHIYISNQRGQRSDAQRGYFNGGGQ